MKFDKGIITNTGVIVAIIFTIGSAILAAYALTIDGLTSSAKIFVFLVFGCNIINLYL